MSATYRPVQWNRNKYVYDIILLFAVTSYILVYLRVAPLGADPARVPEYPILRMRAFGSCAFLMLTLVLCIGPLARLDQRFLPFLYNRRHFGVLTALVALSHANFVLGWYYAFSPVDPYVALLSANTSFQRILGFPFEIFGIVALVILVLLAVTSHDFWLSFLTPSLWKTLHMSIYGAYAAVAAHIAFGSLSDARNPVFGLLAAGSMAAVSILHALASRREARRDDEAFAAVRNSQGSWVRVCHVDELQEGRARVVPLPGERAAIFYYDGKVSALSNICAHQNGPLGEGRIVDGLVTCPWHGFQYRPEDGCAPAPFIERVSTYRLALEDGYILIDPIPNAPGTRVEPLHLAVSAP